MSKPRTRHVLVGDSAGGRDSKPSVAKSRHLVTQDETWHWFKLFCLEKNVNMTEGFETMVMVLHKYKTKPEVIGTKLFKALETLRELSENDERLTMKDI